MIRFTDIEARLYDGRHLKVADWAIEEGQYWAIAGTNGSGKTALSALFGGLLIPQDGTLANLPQNLGYVSLEAQREQIEQELKDDDSDLTDCFTLGTPVREFLGDNLGKYECLLDALCLTHLLDKGFRSLSTGESRKVLWIKQLAEGHEWLVLDEPFEGLDVGSREVVTELLQKLINQGQKILWVANRMDEIPEWISHLAFVHDAQMISQGERDSVLAQPEISALVHFDQDLPELPPRPGGASSLADDEPLVTLTNGFIQYGDRTLFEGLNWQINPGEHWAVQGPNGCGKTSLLQMITGDNPACYRNQLHLFGMKRGSGESIWDIKKHIGLVSAALQWEYRATTNVLSALISGLYDSIGVYQAVGDDDKQLGLKWLSILGLRDKANQSLQHLSYGEQRLVLIGRALIKQPPLLILDEPCQGLDDISRQMVLAFISRLASQKNMTMLYVTHHPTEIPAAVSRRLVFTPDSTGHSKVDQIID